MTQARKTYYSAWYAAHKDEYNAARRERYRTDEAYRKKDAERKRSYIRRNLAKVNEKQKEVQKRWWSKVKDAKNAERRAKYLRDSAYREHVLQLSREYKARKKEQAA